MAINRDAISKFVTQAQLETYFVEVIGMITVKSYGAKGDNITDDTQAILDALADVQDNDLKSLYFPHGQYVVDPSLISAADFTGIFCWGDNSSFSGISHPINQIGLDLAPVTAFLGLTDSPPTFAGQTGKALVVNGAEDALEFLSVYTSDNVDTLLEDYYTKTELDDGALDARYYTETEIDDGFATKQDLTDLTLGIFPDDTLNGASLIDETVSTEKLEDGAVTVDKVADDSLTTAKMATEQKRGSALGVASLDETGQVPLDQLGNVVSTSLAPVYVQLAIMKLGGI